MDDLDRELKEIQLKRQRLALEREMAFKSVFTKSGALVRSTILFVSGAPIFIIQRWKLILSVVVVAAAVAAAVINGAEWKARYEIDQSILAASEKYGRWLRGRDNFIRSQCHIFECSEDQKAQVSNCLGKAKDLSERLECSRNHCTEENERQALSNCRDKAEGEYKAQNPI